MNRVTIDRVEADDDVLRADVSCQGHVARFFADEPFVARYGRSIEAVPDAILVVPVLAHVCPVAWASGADVVVETADERFLDSLEAVQETLRDMYPEFMEGGEVRCDDPTTVPPQTAMDRSATLFTGGVDSVATYVRHREEFPDLISVKGWVIREEETERWQKNRAFFESFAEERSLANHFVESNMRSFLQMPLLQAHYQRYLEGAWYSSVGHGLGLLGLCAPLAHTAGIGTLYIAATHTESWTRPWGSHPDIDDHVRWSGTEAVHDGFELTRQDKLDRIAEYVESESVSPTFRTCTKSETPENCNTCEKCYRTIVGLLFAGLDPNDHGYAYDETTPLRIRDEIDSGKKTLSWQKKYHWDILRDTARERTSLPGQNGDELLRWLRTADFEEYVEQSDKPLGQRFVQTAARHTPTPVYDTLYPMYRRLSGKLASL